MAEAVEHSLQYLTDPDLHAIVAYLKQTRAIDSGEAKPRYSIGKPDNSEAKLRGNMVSDVLPGWRVYTATCTACHGARGEGSSAYPALFHNTTIGAGNPANLIATILYGVHRGPGIEMPGFGPQASYTERLSDQQIADVSNYVLASFGQAAANVTQEDVALARAGKAVTVLEAGPRVTRGEIVERFRNAPVKLSLTNIKLQGAGSPFPNPPHIPSTYGDYLQQTGPVKYPTKYLRVVGGTTWHFGSALWRMIPNDFKIQTLYGRGRDWPMTYDELEPYYCEAEEELGVSGVDGQDESDHGGPACPPRSKPFPMKGLAVPYFMSRLNCRWAATTRSTNPMAAPRRPIKSAPCARATTTATRSAPAAPNTTARYFVLAAYGIESPKLLLMSTSEKYPNGIANSSDQVGRNLMGHTGIAMNVMASEDLWPGQGPTELLVYMNYRDGEFRKDIPSYKTKKDAIGVPLPELYYSVNDYWNAGRDFAVKDLQKMAGLIKADILKMDTSHQDRQHIMGTTIMGADPANSVVDKDCRAHDHPNLFIVGTNVMPAPGCVNPTLTGAALSLRTADVMLREV